MKFSKTAYVLIGFFTLSFVLTTLGALAKILHLTGANLLLVVGMTAQGLTIGAIVVFVLLYLIRKEKRVA